ncbi:hypothetical protein ACTU45_34180 [Streptomyces sp. 24-1644]|uniref:hypothetical protein n=1 Tax=Streptomyces sp. 24-1644 TaxID=3457315 RepID=UPI003FA7C0D5
MDVRHEVLEGQRAIPRLGRVVEVNRAHPPYAMPDAAGAEEPVTAFLRDLALGDSSPLTCRSYGYGMLRWYRLLWLPGTGWERATESEVAVLTGWLLGRQPAASAAPGRCSGGRDGRSPHR